MAKKLLYVALMTVLLGPAVLWAASPYDRVAYYDDDYPTNWADRTSAQNVRDAVADAGYRIVDAGELKTWMDGHIASGGLSVVIMCNDIFPDTVIENNDENCTLRQYLNAGGKVVFYADIPFWNQGHADGSNTNWGQNGANGILGFSAAPNAAPAVWDSGSTVTITEDGVIWGLTETWTSQRPAAPDAWDNMTILATDDNGAAAAWVAHFIPDDTYRGFVRIRDTGGMPNVEDLIRAAEYALNIEMAFDPAPENESVDILRDSVLSWTPGAVAVTHDVYFGTSFADVNAASRDNPLGVLVSENQSDTTYDPEGLLEFGTTYYWRIDEVNGAPDYTIFRGEIWSFTAEPVAYPVEGIAVTTNATYDATATPENTINGSGLNELDQHSDNSNDMFIGAPTDGLVYLQYEFDRIYKLNEMLVWNYNVQFENLLGFGFKNVTVEYSTDGESWTTLADVEFAQSTSRSDYEANTSVDFEGVAAKYVRLTANDRWGTGPTDKYGLSEVRFLYIPAHARQPEPDEGDTDVDVTTALVWRGGRDAETHEVYLGTDPEALSLAGTPTSPSYAAELNLDVTYYWKVDETDADGVTWAGDLWSFSTQEYLVIDDFESYNDEDNLIYETWEDGWINDTGSTVGYWDAPFAETEIVHSGNQAMPLFYDNADFDTSEADLALNQDWTANGIQSLVLYFRGNPDNNGGQLYVRINNTKIPYDGDAADIEVAGWTMWSITLADTGANLSNVATLTVGVEGAGAQGTVYIDDIRLIPAVIESGDIGVDIAISTPAGWFGQAAADREMQEIVNNVPARITTFTSGDLDGLADWVAAHTGDGVSDLLILCGQFPDTIYGGANAEPDGSLAELFLDDGNTIINTGDWIFYVGTVSNNNAEGLQNMMDIPAVTVAGGDNTAVTVTADGQELTPSLQDFATDRPFHLDTLEGDWYTELVLAQNADGTLADPVIVRNSATGGRIGVFHQAASEDDLPRGEVISEWINNWYVDAVSGN